MSYMGTDPGDLTPDEMYGRDLLQDEPMGDEAAELLPLIVHAPDCTCQGDGLCLSCAIEDEMTFAVFCKRTGMNPNHERAA